MAKLDKVRFSEIQKILLSVFVTALCFFALIVFDGLMSFEVFFLLLLVFSVFFVLFKILNSRYQHYIDEPQPLSGEGKIVVRKVEFMYGGTDDIDENKEITSYLSIYVSNGIFSGRANIFYDAYELKNIGEALTRFPQKKDDEYFFTYGSSQPFFDYLEFFQMRAFASHSKAISGLEFKMDLNVGGRGKNGCCFSFQAEPAAICRLGNLFIKFAELKHAEFHWDNVSDAMFKELQYDTEELFPLIKRAEYN